MASKTRTTSALPQTHLMTTTNQMKCSTGQLRNESLRVASEVPLPQRTKRPRRQTTVTARPGQTPAEFLTENPHLRKPVSDINNDEPDDTSDRNQCSGVLVAWTSVNNPLSNPNFDVVCKGQARGTTRHFVLSWQNN